MIFIFDKETKQLFGMATRVFDNGTWREATMEELYPTADHSKLGYVHVEDSPKYSMNPEGWQLKVDDQGNAIGIERKPTPAKVHLTTNAVDTDGDDLPELPADGSSRAVINIEVKTPRDQLVTDELLLDIRTTGGTLSDRRITTTTGQATVELTASLETVQVTVTVAAAGITPASLTFEFMPAG